jgi:MoaA/NifB/PqqE/SkfB family radical SAM enzyme
MRRILDRFPGAINVDLGGGEPFLHPSLFEMVRLAHQRRFIVHMPTNGTLLAGRMEDLIEAPIEVLNVSLNGVDAESFANVTGSSGSLFESVVEGLGELVRRRRPGGYPHRIRTSYICRKDNLHEAIEFIRLSEKIGVDEAKLRNLRYYGEPGISDSLSLRADDPEVLDFYEDLRGRQFKIPVLLPRAPRSDDFQKCDLPFRILAIDGEGFVGPCCTIAPMRRWGNIFENPGVWNGPEMAEARLIQKDFLSALPAVCRYCEERITETRTCSRSLFG